MDEKKYSYMPLEGPSEYHAMIIRQLEQEIEYLKNRQVELSQEMAKVRKMSNWFITEYAQGYGISNELAIADYESMTYGL